MSQKIFAIEIPFSEDSTEYFVRVGSALEAAGLYLKACQDEHIPVDGEMLEEAGRLRATEVPEASGVPTLLHWDEMKTVTIHLADIPDYQAAMPGAGDSGSSGPSL